MKSLKYLYTQKDLLKNPQKYQRSKFQGIEFLNSFKQSREDTSEYISKNISITQLSDIYTSFSESITILNSKNSHYDTNTLLISCLLKDEYLESKKYLLEKILKNFEVNKKIYSDYEFSPFNHSKNFSDMKNYVLFSLVCAKIFEQTKNLKFLNSLLKLNDILLSRIKFIDESMTLSLVYHAIDFELDFVNDLLKTKVRNK